MGIQLLTQQHLPYRHLQVARKVLRYTGEYMELHLTMNLPTYIQGQIPLIISF